MKRSKNCIAIPPGTTIKEQLVERGMLQKEFALRMGLSEKHVSRLINGEVLLTLEVARKLEMVLGVPAQFWCNLEAIYREELIKVQEENAMDADIMIAKNMPYKEMAKIGWVVDVTEKTERIRHLRKYFEIAELKYLQSTLLPRIACRKLSEKEKDDCALIVWAQKAKLEARRIKTKAIDIERLKGNISRIQEVLTMETGELYAKLTELLADCGIAIVFLPRMSKMFLHGATFLDGDKIVIGLMMCDEGRDEFCFSLFHELAHVIYGHVRKPDGISEEDETCADEYARKILNGCLKE